MITGFEEPPEEAGTQAGALTWGPPPAEDADCSKDERVADLSVQHARQAQE